MSCKVSEVLAPEAGPLLLTAIVDLTKLTRLPLFDVLISSLYSTKLTSVNTFAGTLSTTPFPIVYVIVNVVLDGACPYVLVYKKFDGSISTSTLRRNPANPFPTLSGFGTISSSLLSEMPAPNCNSNLLSLRKRVI